MKQHVPLAFEQQKPVTLRVRVWIETRFSGIGFCANFVTLRVRVWIETPA